MQEVSFLAQNFVPLMFAGLFIVLLSGFPVACITDKRKVEVHLTEQGDALVTDLVQLHRAELVSLQGRFTVPDLVATEASLPARRRRPGRAATPGG